MTENQGLALWKDQRHWPAFMYIQENPGDSNNWNQERSGGVAVGLREIKVIRKYYERFLLTRGPSHMRRTNFQKDVLSSQWTRFYNWLQQTEIRTGPEQETISGIRNSQPREARTRPLSWWMLPIISEGKPTLPKLLPKNWRKNTPHVVLWSQFCLNTKIKRHDEKTIDNIFYEYNCKILANCPTESTNI